MTDYTDLIERLRENADLDAAEHVPHEVVQMQYEAADALEQLLAGREELVAALINQRDMWVDTRDSAKELQDNWMVDFAGQNIGQAEVVLAKLGADKTGE